jgi:hypothetical protein
LQVIAAYNLVDKVPAKLKKYKPFITGTYTYLSGEDSMRTSGAYHGWDAMYEDQTTGHLMNRILGFTNAQVIVLNGKIVPVEDVTLDITYANQWLNKRFQDGISPCLRNVTGAQTFNVTRNRHVGQELDASLTYDYTEDVQFNLLSGVFFPGDMFSSQNDTKATEVIGSMKVVF